LTAKTDREIDLSGKLKEEEKLPPWTDPTEQLAVTFGNDNGVITRRYSRFAYRKYSDLTPQEQKSGKFKPKNSTFGNEDYACISDGKGGLKRVIDEKRSEKGLGFLKDITKAGRIPAGIEIIEGLTQMMQEGTIVRIVVESRTYNGSVNYNVKSVKKALDCIEVAEEVAEEQLPE
jgi:hypothetical protein